jgi:transcriptional regulator with XRE-family HTH domain
MTIWALTKPMGQRARPKPKHLAAKLLAIRQRLGLSQSELARLLDYQLTPARVSECESDSREPNLLVLLAYSRAGNIPVEKIIDDEIDLTRK